MGEMLMPSEAARSSSRNGVPGTSSPRMIASRNSSSAASAMVRWRIPARSAAIVRTDTFTLFAAAAQRTSDITFRTLVHVLPFHNPTVLASEIAFFDTLVGGRYEFGVGRGHAWIAPKAGIPVEETRARYEEGLRILLGALDNERFSYDGSYFKVEDTHIVPRP